MVVGAFPAAKLGALLLKQISKPIANVLKNHAKSSPIFRKYVCMPPAQFYNWCELKSKMWILNLGKPVNIPVLNEAQAIELGANLLGEAIIFIIAAGILINEYARSYAKEQAKETARKEEIISLQKDIRDLYIQAEEERAQIRELIRKLGDQDTQIKTLANKLGVKSSPPSSPREASPSNTPIIPPYSPANEIVGATSTAEVDNAKDVPEVHGLNTYSIRYGDGSLLKVRQVVDQIGNELWNYPNSEYQEPLLVLGVNHFINIFKFGS